MVVLFKEKESEHNWESRHKSIIYLRSILRGNGPEKYPDAIVSSMRQMVDGIIKSVIFITIIRSFFFFNSFKKITSFFYFYFF